MATKRWLSSKTPLDIVIINNLLVHMFQGFNLLNEERLFEASLIELMPCLLLVTHQSVCITEPVLKQLEVILGKLMIQVTEIVKASYCP